jgi:ferredoxin-type protein NapG
MKSMADENKFNRRRFFREGLRELLKPLSKTVGPLEDAIRQLDQLGMPPSSARPMPLQVPSRPIPTGTAPNRVGGAGSTTPSTLLRPPGAVPEAEFADTCSRCGDCVAVCPAEAIKIDSATGIAGGRPYIDIDATPCVVCTGLHCMDACPTGALLPTALVNINMGTAHWNASTCLRTLDAGEEACTICLDDCPLGTAAITLQHNRIHVIEKGCIGCGICQNHCPTTPKSIVVIPAEDIDSTPSKS